jgi:hypothetical protein
MLPGFLGLAPNTKTSGGKNKICNLTKFNYEENIISDHIFSSWANGYWTK